MKTPPMKCMLGLMLLLAGAELFAAGQIEALAEAEAGVMLEGEHVFWSSREGGVGGAMRINAQQFYRMR